jgi:hypothetical protein
MQRIGRKNNRKASKKGLFFAGQSFVVLSLFTIPNLPNRSNGLA